LVVFPPNPGGLAGSAATGTWKGWMVGRLDGGCHKDWFVEVSGSPADSHMLEAFGTP